MRIHVALSSISPLVMHNIRLADPRDTFVKQIKALTGNKKKTDSDLEEIERLEWYAGLYYDEEIGPYIPGPNLKACIQDGAAPQRKGKAVASSVLVAELKIPLLYAGPRDSDKLWADANHRFRCGVRIGGARVFRMRPIFPRWSLETILEVDESDLNFSDVERFLNVGGTRKALGDNRPEYGRFASVAKLIE